MCGSAQCFSSVFQYVAKQYISSVLAVCGSVMQHVAYGAVRWQCVSVCCSAVCWQCVAAYCSVLYMLQCVTVWCSAYGAVRWQCVPVCCSALAVCSSLLQCRDMQGVGSVWQRQSVVMDGSVLQRVGSVFTVYCSVLAVCW